jgi:hypothetical protein
MTTRLKLFSFLAVIALLNVLLTACGSTKMKDTWQAEGFSKKQLDNVLVIAASSNKTNRIMFEDGFARSLQKEGITAYTSYSALGDAVPTRESIVAYIKNNNIHYVLATKVDNVKTNTDYVPESVVSYYTGPSYSPYWTDNAVTMVHGSYTDVQTVVMLVTTIYDAKTEQAVWSGVSETFEVNSFSLVGKEIAENTLNHISR